MSEGQRSLIQALPRDVGPRVRYDIRGHELTGRVYTTKCHDCGMGLFDAAEWHPYEACQVYRGTHDSREVWRMLARRVIEENVPWKG